MQALRPAVPVLVAVLAAPVLLTGARSPRQITWNFDRLDRIGGLPVTVEGNPKVIETPIGKAIEFDGVDDELFIEEHPLAGAERFTFEAVFRPDGGATAQRWFHLAEIDPTTGFAVSQDSSTSESYARFLFEIRVVGSQWYFDGVMNSRAGMAALIVPSKLHPVGVWYHVAGTYDGNTFRTYVNGELQAEAKIAFVPHGPGRAAIGARMNRVTYFHGAVAKARFTHEALHPSAFMPFPGRT